MASSGSDTPVIGLTTYLERAHFGLWQTEAAVLHRSYLDSVRAAGGNPVLLPPVGDWRADTIGWLDGLVLAGGADLDPVHYGQSPHPATGNPQPERDCAEFALLTAALELDIPVLAVCRGMQLLNVALGGTLHQHTPEVTDTTHHQPSPGTFGKVTVRYESDSVTYDPGGLSDTVTYRRGECDSVTVSCHHHQSVDKLANGLEPVAIAEDGTIEAVRHTSASFLLGVQFHPEQGDPLGVFGALVLAAKQRSVQR